MGSAVSGIDRLDPPQWAARQTSNYSDSLIELQSAIQEFESLLVKDRGRRPRHASSGNTCGARRSCSGRPGPRQGASQADAGGRAAPTFQMPLGDDDGESVEPAGEESA